MSPVEYDNRKELVAHISKNWLLFKQRAKQILREHNYDLTFEQIMVLHILFQEEGLNFGQVAERADRERTTISRMMDGLQKRNLVVRVPDRLDQRHKLLYLTPLGKELVDRLEPVGQELFDQLFGGISESELLASLATMKKMLQNLTK